MMIWTSCEAASRSPSAEPYYGPLQRRRLQPLHGSAERSTRPASRAGSSAVPAAYVELAVDTERVRAPD